MARKLKSDRILFLTTTLLVALSLVMVYSASAAVALQRYEQANFYLIRQATWSLMGLGLLAVVMRVDYRLYRRPSVVWWCLILVALALVGVLFSDPVNNARRWYRLWGLSFQPSELAKLLVIIFSAALLERRMHRINDVGYSLTPLGITVGGLVGLVLLQPDFGTAMSIVLICGVMVFAAGINYAYIAGAALTMLPLVVTLVMSSDYRRRRVLTFLDPWQDPLGDGFQIIQSLIAVGTGGVTGRGLMNGVQKLFYLPEAHTDFIYAVISEEFGLIGATLVLVCFGLITWRGLRIALGAPDTFGALLAIGLTTMIVAQALVNVSVVLGLMPTKGLPLPFISAGGSSLLVNLVGMGVLLNVSQHTVPEV